MSYILDILADKWNEFNDMKEKIDKEVLQILSILCSAPEDYQSGDSGEFLDVSYHSASGEFTRKTDSFGKSIPDKKTPKPVTMRTFQALWEEDDNYDHRD